MAPLRPLFRKVFEPQIGIGDLVAMLDSTSLRKEDSVSLFTVSHVEAIPFVDLVLNSIGGVPAGYTADPKATTTAIPAGQSQAVKPDSLSLDKYQLGQWRFRFRFIAPPAGLVVDDFDVTATQGIPRWHTSNLQGVTNYIMQGPNPTDLQLAPVQGANQIAPASYPGADAWELAASTELWSYYLSGPSFTLLNAGSVATSGTFAWILQAKGFVYNLEPVMDPPDHQESIAGYPIQLPAGVSRHDVYVVPIAGRLPRSGPA